jgi:uncharacterized membrane protein
MFSFIFICIAILWRTKNKKNVFFFVLTWGGDLYFSAGFGKYFGSRLRVFSGGPFGVRRGGICERSE